jgi:hypothetical protein
LSTKFFLGLQFGEAKLLNIWEMQTPSIRILQFIFSLRFLIQKITHRTCSQMGDGIKRFKRFFEAHVSAYDGKTQNPPSAGTQPGKPNLELPHRSG